MKMNKTFNYEKALKKASKGYKYWNSEQQKYVIDPSKFQFSMKWYPRLKIFKYKRRSECTFDPKTGFAYSYGHWCFVTKINGKYIFNHHRYSNTTSTHQNMVKDLLNELGISIYCSINSREGFDQNIFDEEPPTMDISYLYEEIFKLEIEQARPRAHSRQDQINNLKKDIDKLKKIGIKCSKQKIEQIKKNCYSDEQWRLKNLENKRLERKHIRNAIKRIKSTPKENLTIKDVKENEKYSEVTEILLNLLPYKEVIKLDLQHLETKKHFRLGSYTNDYSYNHYFLINLKDEKVYKLDRYHSIDYCVNTLYKELQLKNSALNNVL